MYCYGAAAGDRERFRDSVLDGQRTFAGDVPARRARRAGGRDGDQPRRCACGCAAARCRARAWRGSGPSRRRGGGSTASNEPGVATRIMHETIRLAREQGQVVSALMPFRGSFYEHFGYGIMERRLRVDGAGRRVPEGLVARACGSSSPATCPSSSRAASASREARAVRHGAVGGACGTWHVDALGQDRHVRRRPAGRRRAGARVDDAPARARGRRQRHDARRRGRLRGPRRACGGSSRSSAACATSTRVRSITLPADLQLNRLLREPQITHRDNKNHPTPEVRPYTRMQLRVLDHKRFVEAMRLPPDVRGQRRGDGSRNRGPRQPAVDRGRATGTHGVARPRAKRSSNAATRRGRPSSRATCAATRSGAAGARDGVGCRVGVAARRVRPRAAAVHARILLGAHGDIKLQNQV